MTRRMEFTGVKPLDLPNWQVFLYGTIFVIIWMNGFEVSTSRDLEVSKKIVN